ncbi:hypothetical protein [Mucilaginibacter dorajii]|uniref:Uncharacterized protein n=1 Tax=Mucilaginibacter dorajii TaxID=692994 RepID=A0ABP7PER4_9SPHI|nr:hypothetical protein [Mucilaginibacter dorajii]MCS3734747.1 hypothetical protein [Mucilaginibacter dorajii]
MSFKLTAVLIPCLLAATISNAQQKGKTVQVDIDTLLNARPVTTFTDGKLTSWTKGIDGGGDGDGYLSMAAALFHGDKTPHALPDGSLIAATATHPAIKLHYNNTDNWNNQARYMAGEGSFAFNVPRRKYSGMYLGLTSSEGASQLKVELVYLDGAETKNFTLPDYYNDIPATDANFGYLVHDLAKWGKNDVMTEKDHHNIDLLNIHPDPKRILIRVSVSKTKPGFLMFWSATGVQAVRKPLQGGGVNKKWPGPGEN